jgi:hypothetical protein
MQAGDWSVLYPTAPAMTPVVSFVILQMKEAAGKKELALFFRRLRWQGHLSLGRIHGGWCRGGDCCCKYLIAIRNATHA